MDIGTFCWLSARFSAVTVISSSSPAAASAPNTRSGPIIAATANQAKQRVDILIIILTRQDFRWRLPRSARGDEECREASLIHSSPGASAGGGRRELRSGAGPSRGLPISGPATA